MIDYSEDVSLTTGDHAETVAAAYLQSRGYRIVDRNWRTPLCEIDIIAEKDNIKFFVEVKYRGSDRQGGGLEYITKRKLKQMEFAARCWVQDNNWKYDYSLSAIEVTADFTVTEFIETIV